VSAERVAILGAGLLGACTALELARRGRRVTLIDRAPDVMQGASRWNEGKIHLGYLYPADPSLNTAARLIPGALAFRELMERLTGCSLENWVSEGDVYLVHRKSVVNRDAYAGYTDAVTRMVHDAAGEKGARYLGDSKTAGVHHLSRAELAQATSSEDVVAGFRVPERSVSTVPVADAMAAAVRAEPLIEIRVGVDVRAVRRRDDARLDVIADGADDLTAFDTVVNALWQSRLLIDATMGSTPPGAWSHRLRAAIYAKAPASTIRCATICTGPFGDVKQYADGRIYLSWYNAGLLAQGNALEPPSSDAASSSERLDRVRTETLAALARFFPDVARVETSADSIEVHAGWVYALGSGSLSDPASSLHRRDQFAITADRGYISVDTGKYSVAPWLAQRVAAMLTA
jgi:glycine/D-amino acid oxidase-like deaminating enzyme